jgi:hypothetical protein
MCVLSCFLFSMPLTGNAGQGGRKDLDQEEKLATWVLQACSKIKAHWAYIDMRGIFVGVQGQIFEFSV